MKYRDGNINHLFRYLSQRYSLPFKFYQAIINSGFRRIILYMYSSARISYTNCNIPDNRKAIAIRNDIRVNPSFA